MAVQPQLGVLSKRWAGARRSDLASIAVDGSYLTTFEFLHSLGRSNENLSGRGGVGAASGGLPRIV